MQTHQPHITYPVYTFGSGTAESSAIRCKFSGMGGVDVLQFSLSLVSKRYKAGLSPHILLYSHFLFHFTSVSNLAFTKMAQILTTTTTSNPMKMGPLTGPHATKSTKYTQVISKFGKHVPTKPAPGKVSPTSTKIGVWDLKSQEFTELEAPEATESLFNGIVDTESVIGIDGRKAIPKKHYAPGGKYRGQ
jgi:hypothetical protein